MRIGELAERTGVSVRSLRYYEDQGLLVPSRTTGGHRTYGPPAADRVIRIQELYAAGLNSSKIRAVLACTRDVDGGPNEWATPLLAETLAAERTRLNRRLSELHRTRDVLDDVIAAATRPAVTTGWDARVTARTARTSTSARPDTRSVPGRPGV